MYTQRPLNDTDLQCHVCGKPARWYDREFHSTYVLGEALCDDCNNKFSNFLKPQVEIRHLQVISFAKAMDEVLCKNDHKGGWNNCTKEWLRWRLIEETGEYFARLAVCDTEDRLDIHDKELAKKELIDIANFAMMLWDRS